MKKQVMKKSEDHFNLPITSVRSGKGVEISEDVYYFTNKIVNVIMLGKPNSRDWVLVDAGMPGSAPEIIKKAEKRFGKANPPRAIILTHGHFDHVGGLVELLKQWQTLVYAHPLERLYLTGEKRYAEPDSEVEGGVLAKISSIYPIEPIDIESHLMDIPRDNNLPGLPDWKWVHVPGHSPGQIALFREKDSLLIAGDSFITVKQDSLYKVIVQKNEVNGPPVYLTTNWEQAGESVLKLYNLKPRLAITGHGQFIKGKDLENGLKNLIKDFEDRAIPEYGKFVKNENKEH